MNKYKVCVYAIAKNEEKFVKRWYESIKEADEVYVLDTGSTDNTKELLEELGAHVKQIIFDPFRFDVARNESLSLVPDNTDICICCDLDEVFEPGWRNGYIWKHPVHEVLYPIKEFKEHKITTDEITVNHYPDNEKNRGSYLPLLELSIKEEPENDRNMHYWI